MNDVTMMNSRQAELLQRRGYRRVFSNESQQATVDMLRRDNESSIAATVRESNKLMSTEQQEFKEAFEKIKFTTCMVELDYKENIQQREQELNYVLGSSIRLNQHKEIIRDLQSKLQTSESMAENYEQRCQDLQRITESLKRGMQSIFTKFDFTEEEYAPPPVAIEVNMVHNLGLIEQKANQLLQHYSQVRGLLKGPPSTKANTQGRTPFIDIENDSDRAAAAEEEDVFSELQDMFQNLVSVLSKVGQKLNPPTLKDNSSQQSDVGDDLLAESTRPLTRDELKHRTLNKLQKRLGLGGMNMLSLTGGGATGITNSSTLNNSSSSTANNGGSSSGGGGGGGSGVPNESHFIGPAAIPAVFWMLSLCRSLVSAFFCVRTPCSSVELVALKKLCHHHLGTSYIIGSRANWRPYFMGILLVFCRIADSATSLPQSEYLALYDLYNSTGGVDWSWSHKPQDGIPWVFSADVNPCADNWQGVDCIVVNSPPLHTYHVSSVILEGMNLKGPLPNTLDDLPYLTILEVDHNQLNGSIPKSIGNLKNLQKLSLYHNQLTGAIPSSIGNLTDLEWLDLNINQLTGAIPSCIGNLTNLKEIVLNDNQLTGSIPNSIGNLTNLQYLYLYHNQLTGSIPSSIGSLTNLHKLDLNINKLTGSIHSSIGNLTNLQWLDLNINQLTGSIPSSICNLTNLQQLFLNNNQLTGSIPSSIGNLTILHYLYLYHNHLTGSISSSIISLSKVQYLYLDHNQLTGSIPSSIGDLTNLQQLDLNNNQLTDSIPSSIGSLAYAQYLYLFNNQLTGSIPNSIGNLMNLQKLILDFNQLTGSIPSSIGNSTSLTYLSLSHNYITGSAPSSIGNLTNVQYLDLSDNQLTGQLSLLGHMSALVFLGLQGNRFTGPLTYLFSISQSNLQAAQLDGNKFTGTLPSVLFDLPSLVSFSMVGSCLHGTLPGNICNATQLEALILYGLTTGASCRARGVQSLLQSRQSFGGTMPPCLLQLPKLVTLLLSSNDLTGSIVSDIVSGSKLLQLDLSHNDLTGSIPNSLQNRSWSLLDFSHNKLSGTLHADLFRPLNATLLLNYSVNPTVSLTSNRLSGPVPSSLRPLKSNLSVLAGNLFECKYDKSNLPQHDSDISNYQCASNDFNVAVYAWLSMCVGACVLMLFLCRHNVSLILQAVIQLSDEHSARLTHLHSLLEEYHVLSKAAWCCAAFCLVVLLPYYAIVSHYEGTHTYQYAYVLSAIYNSGVLPFVLDMVLLGLLIVLVYCSCVVKYPTVTCATGVEKNLRGRWEQTNIVIIYSLANVVVVLGANVAFVYVVLYQSSQVQTLAQVLLSLFKLSWSVAASPYLIRQLDMYFHPEEMGSAQSYFALQLVVSLFNNIAIPCLVVAAIDRNCFSNVLLPPDSQTVTYLLPTCRNIVFEFETCVQTTPELVTLQFTPPFTYSYQCSASFITSYASTFIYLSISTVFLNPVLQYVLLKFYRRLPDGSIAHRMVSKFLPRLLKLSAMDVDRRKSRVLGAVDTLVTLLTQLGILLTFGAVFPPVALAMAVSISAVVVVKKYNVQRFVRAVAERELFAYLDIINAECEKVGTREQMQVAAKILICYCCAFYTLFLFDTLGDAVGFDASVWVLVVFPLLPLALYGAECLWWRVLKEGQGDDVKNKESQGPPRAPDLDIELHTSVSEGASSFANFRKGESDKDHTVNILHKSNV